MYVVEQLMVVDAEAAARTHQIFRESRIFLDHGTSPPDNPCDLP
jgi:hypothetical protein